MKTTYKIITENEFGEMSIKHYNSLEKGIEEYNKAADNGCERCYLLEEKAHYELSGNSFNKILAYYFRKKN